MSRQNAEIVRRMLEARDAGALRAILDDEVEWDGGGREFLGDRPR